MKDVKGSLRDKSSFLEIKKLFIVLKNSPLNVQRRACYCIVIDIEVLHQRLQGNDR